MKAVPITDSLGVELQDLDMSKPFDDDEVEVLREAFDRGGVVLVRGQKLRDEDQDRFVKTLGNLHTFRWGTQVEYLSNVIKDNPSLAGSRRLLFHNDGAYREKVASGTCLYAQDVSPTSPPTAFANTVRAYKNLPQEIKDEIENLHACNAFDMYETEAEQKRVRLADYPEGADLSGIQSYEHPLVITVPHTGEKALFVNEFNTSHIVEYGVDSQRGEELIQTLFSYAYAEDNIYTHHYANDDLVLFNNWAVQHARTGQIDHNPRTLRRLVLESLNW
ncbi:TauD/TfdA family dioxygenase [Pseudonocardia kujensis]|uniref:TauD/TfdA dioxygenase family protein n=1 Tax=Pseudonocardia kujensis TaxID=1128675 RepID=UPI001E43BB1F|nr:TauD/TfdA family dioxygenase [Pseudonocardia kujensis]MCE0763524.1 TauD/TfdA family dioxygenase [Pseudonocardia kujensis]